MSSSMLIYKSDSPEKFLEYKSARVVVVPVPYEKTTSYGKGTKNGPEAICEASSQVELYDEELEFESCNVGIATVDAVHSLDKLETETLKIVNDGKIPIILGGEHTVSAAPIRACKKKYKNLSVVHFDAHADLRDEFEGTKLNHACVMRRVFEAGVPFVQIGIRNHSLEEAEFMKKEGLRKPFYSADISSSVKWMDEAISCLTDEVYLTFDVDAFDPSIIPATGTPEPGGLNWHQVTEFFKKLAAAKKIVGADFVELAPIKNLPASDFTIAKLIYKLIGYIGKSKRY
ncbi:MAG: agmatinase [Deltaproteobacteria bacterium]|nr:agmatinase [Deltaproteobacteria bacterium]